MIDFDPCFKQLSRIFFSGNLTCYFQQQYHLFRAVLGLPLCISRYYAIVFVKFTFPYMNIHRITRRLHRRIQEIQKIQRDRNPPQRTKMLI